MGFRRRLARSYKIAFITFLVVGIEQIILFFFYWKWYMWILAGAYFYFSYVCYCRYRHLKKWLKYEPNTRETS